MQGSAGQWVAVLDFDPTLQQVALRILGKNTGVCFGVVVFHPKVVVFPGRANMLLTFGHANRHDAAPSLDEQLLKIEEISGPGNEQDYPSADHC